uniref:Putative secreted protein n=1 Tax=Ixodes ricinus TaxID=34613 RepID=A0A147BK79_IXORI
MNFLCVFICTVCSVTCVATLFAHCHRIYHWVKMTLYNVVISNILPLKQGICNHLPYIYLFCSSLNFCIQMLI